MTKASLNQDHPTAARNPRRTIQSAKTVSSRRFEIAQVVVIARVQTGHLSHLIGRRDRPAEATAAMDERRCMKNVVALWKDIKWEDIKNVFANHSMTSATHRRDSQATKPESRNSTCCTTLSSRQPWDPSLEIHKRSAVIQNW